jgi:Protein phosphatase 2C
MRWSSATASERGSSHERSGTVNQDAVAVVEHSTARIVAVADGHGSSSHVRSDMGSRLAVDLAGELGKHVIDLGALRRPKHLVAEYLAHEFVPELVASWRSRVDAHVAAEPWTVADLDRGPGLVDDPYHGYGTTLMIAIADERTVALLQLGDGDIVVGRVSGTITQPMPGDDRLIGNQTTSMCLPAAADDFRVAVVEIGDDPIRFVSLTTDGYANAFVSPEWAAEVGHDLLGHLDTNGLDWVEARLNEWLSESASVGGDDVTMGLLVAETVAIEVQDAVGLDDGPTAVMPGIAPPRDLSAIDLDATTLRPVKRRRFLRPAVLVPALLAVVAGAATVVVLLVV